MVVAQLEVDSLQRIWARSQRFSWRVPSEGDARTSSLRLVVPRFRDGFHLALTYLRLKMVDLNDLSLNLLDEFSLLPVVKFDLAFQVIYDGLEGTCKSLLL